MKKVLEFVGRYLVITIGALIYATAVALFLDPNNMAPGGVTGVSVIINRLVGIETGTLIFVFNIPIIILGAWKFGIKFIVSTVYSLFIISLATNLIPMYFDAITSDRILAALIGGSLMAVGIGMLFRIGSTTGGTDIIIKIVRQKYPYIKTGQFFLLIDAFIIVAAAIVFRDIEVALYAAVAIFVSSIVLDKVLYGSDGAKLVYIICNNPQDIADKMLQELGVGVTFIKGEGAYMHKDKSVIMCVMRRQSFPKLRNLLKREDKEAFMIISSASEVFGEGFKRHDSLEI